MKKRIITGAAIGAVFIGVVLLSLIVEKLVFDAFVLLLMLGASIEVARVLGQRFAKPLMILPIIGIFLGYGAFFALQKYNSDFALWGFFGAQALMFVAAVLWVSFDKTKTKYNITSTSFVLVYPILLLSFMLELNYIPNTISRSAAILLLFLVTTFTDVSAFFVGSTLKGPKLAPKISPKKTVSGAIGGLMGGMLAGCIVFLMAHSGAFTLLGLRIRSDIDALHYILLGLFGSVFTQCGDLLASFVKRRAGVKDYGHLLPGHGGVMDRIDGMMLNAFIINLYIMMIL